MKEKQFRNTGQRMRKVSDILWPHLIVNRKKSSLKIYFYIAKKILPTQKLKKTY